MGLVSSNKSWANFSNRSDSNYTRDNCCIFDVYTTSSQQIQYSEFGRAFKCHPISLPTTLLTRQHLQSTGDPNVLFVLSIPVPIDLPTDRLSRGSDSRRAIKSSTWSEILGPSFNVTKRSVFLFLFFFTGETQVGNAPSLRFFVGERRDNLSLFLLLVEWKIVESTKRGKKGPLFAQGHAQQSGTDLSRKLLCLGHLNANLVTLHSPGYNGVKGGKKGLVL